MKDSSSVKHPNKTRKLLFKRLNNSNLRLNLEFEIYKQKSMIRKQKTSNAYKVVVLCQFCGYLPR